MHYTTYEALSDLQRSAVDKAQETLEFAYSPYSRFKAGACLFSPDGTFISGANFENSAYGSTICAERSAVLRANAMGMRVWSGIAIIARGESFDTTEVTAPCGGCRQVLYEVSQISKCNMEIILSTTKKERIAITTINELLPFGFGPIDIGVDISRFQT